MPADILFQQDEQGIKTKKFISLLNEKKIDEAILFILKNKIIEDHFLSNLYVMINVNVFCDFVKEALEKYNITFLTDSLKNFISDDVNSKLSMLSDDNLHKLVCVLFKHINSSKITNEFIMSCYKRMKSRHQEIFIKSLFDMNKKTFSSFVVAALETNASIHITSALINFIQKDLNNKLSELSDDNLELFFNTLCKHGNRTTIKQLFAEKFILSCYDRLSKRHSPDVFLSLARDSGLDFDFLFQIAMKIAIDDFDGLLLQKLNVYYKDDMALKISQLPKEEQETAQSFLSLNEKDAQFIFFNMKQFTHEKLGKIGFAGGLLTLAEVANRKNYTFDPVALKGLDEFKKYLAIIKDTPPPHRERFVVARDRFHWFSGDIQIKENGEVSVLFIDPLGLEKIDAYDTESAIQHFSDTFPGSTIYFSDLKRQNNNEGCSVFALDDVRHLFTVENYIEDRFNSLHDYLADSAKRLAESKTSKEVENKKRYTLTLCDLPLPLVRTMMSTKLYTTVLPSRTESERNQPVKKTREGKEEVRLTEEYIKNNFFKKQGSDFRNVRLLQALNKMAKFNFNFLLKFHDSQAINDVTSPFKLAAFEERMQEKKKAKPVSSLSQSSPLK